MKWISVANLPVCFSSLHVGSIVTSKRCRVVHTRTGHYLPPCRGRPPFSFLSGQLTHKGPSSTSGAVGLQFFELMHTPLELDQSKRSIDVFELEFEVCAVHMDHRIPPLRLGLGLWLVHAGHFQLRVFWYPIAHSDAFHCQWCTKVCRSAVNKAFVTLL